MAEAAIASEPVIASTEESKASSETSNPVLEPPSIPAAAPDSDGAAPAGTGSDEEAPREPQNYDLEELNRLYREGKLSDPKLVDRRDSLIDVDNKRRQQEAAATAKWHADEQERVAKAKSYRQDLKAELLTNRTKEFERARQAGRQADITLIEEANERSLEAHLDKLEANALEPVTAGLRQMLLHPELYGESPGNLAAVGQMDMAGLIQALYTRAVEVGRQQGPGEEAVVFKTKKELAAHDAEVKKAAEDALKAANPQMVAATGNASRGANGSLNLDRWHTMTYAEREQYRREHPEQIDAMTRTLMGR